MKATYRLLATGLLSSGLLVASCVSGDTVGGGGGGAGKTGNGGLGGFTGGGSLGGFTGGGSLGGFTGGGSLGGFTGGGSLGGFTGGGLGGATGGGGLGGATGTPGAAMGCPRTVPLIDNFDDPTRGGPPTGGYFNFNCGVGAWYIYGDPTLTAAVMPPLSASMPFTSSMPGNGGSSYAAHITATGFAMYGVGMGVNINSVGATIRTVDASAYSGISFWAMGTASGSRPPANSIRVAVPIPASSDSGNGGTCTAVTPSYCNGHWGKVVAITTTWTQYFVKWSELTLDTNSVGGVAFTPSTIIGFHWQVDGTAALPASMNVWIDDLAFTL
jgi:hypothetical protein